MKTNHIGIVDKIRVIKTFPEMLIRFTLLTTDGDRINCIVSKKELANQLMFFENAKTEVAVFGHYNNRTQLIIEKMTIRNPTPFLMAFAMKV